MSNMEDEVKKNLEASIASLKGKMAECNTAISEAKAKKKLLNKDVKKLEKMIAKG